MDCCYTATDWSAVRGRSITTSTRRNRLTIPVFRDASTSTFLLPTSCPRCTCLGFMREAHAVASRRAQAACSCPHCQWVCSIRPTEILHAARYTIDFTLALTRRSESSTLSLSLSPTTSFIEAFLSSSTLLLPSPSYCDRRAGSVTRALHVSEKTRHPSAPALREIYTPPDVCTCLSLYHLSCCICALSFCHILLPC